jgi:hypothetical protein
VSIWTTRELSSIATLFASAAPLDEGALLLVIASPFPHSIWLLLDLAKQGGSRRVCGAINQKAGAVENPVVFCHARLLANGPPETAGVPFT